MTEEREDTPSRDVKPQFLAVIAINVISAAASYAIVVSGWRAAWGEIQTQRYGGTLTVLLLALALISHVQSRKGALPLPLLAAPGVIAPLFAWMNGPVHQVVGYHVISLGIHLFVLYRQHRFAAPKR